MASNWEISLITRSILIFFCYISRYVCTQNTFSCEKKYNFRLIHPYLWTTWIWYISLIQYCHQSFIKSQLKVQKVLLVIWEFLLHNMAYQKEPWETKKVYEKSAFAFLTSCSLITLEGEYCKKMKFTRELGLSMTLFTLTA